MTETVDLTTETLDGLLNYAQYLIAMDNAFRGSIDAGDWRKLGDAFLRLGVVDKANICFEFATKKEEAVK
jgi:hypothetical protein